MRADPLAFYRVLEEAHLAGLFAVVCYVLIAAVVAGAAVAFGVTLSRADARRSRRV